MAGTTTGGGNRGTPSAGCFDFGVPPSNGEDRLYLWTAPSTGTFVFDTLTAGGIDTVLYVWGACGGPELVCNDDFTEPPDGNAGSQVGVQLTAGQSIYIVVDSYATSGSFTLNGTGPVAAGNCCAQRTTPGCEDVTIQECVCDVDMPCCTTAWDRLCVAEAISFCIVQCN